MSFWRVNNGFKGQGWCYKLIKTIVPLWRDKTPMMIITGANALYFNSLCNLLDSLVLHGEIDHIEVWNLGMAEEQYKHLINNYQRFITIRVFQFNLYPDFFNIEVNKGEYAWKSICIGESLRFNPQFRLCFWLDASDAIVRHLDFERHLLKRYGFYSPYSSTSTAALTYPSVLDLFDVEGNKPMLSSGVVGWDRYSIFRSIIRLWESLSYERNFIAPPYRLKKIIGKTRAC